jgi:hypothetical protein
VPVRGSWVLSAAAVPVRRVAVRPANRVFFLPVRAVKVGGCRAPLHYLDFWVFVLHDNPCCLMVFLLLICNYKDIEKGKKKEKKGNRGSG